MAETLALQRVSAGYGETHVLEEIDLALHLRKPAPARARDSAHLVVFQPRHAPPGLEAGLERGADLAGKVLLLPRERARGFEAHHRRVPVEKRFASRRQLEVDQLGARRDEPPGGTFQVGVRGFVRVAPARRAAHADTGFCHGGVGIRRDEAR